MIRSDDAARTLELSVGDLVAEGARGGHLSLAGGWSSAARLRLGQEVHADVAAAREASFRSEVAARRQLVVGGWTVTLVGRIDGLGEEDGRVVVEEVKSTSLPAEALLATSLAEWGDYRRQLEAYLWLVASPGALAPVGRLVLVSVLDGSRAVLGVPFEAARVHAEVLRTLTRLVEDRERRLAWLASRRRGAVPWPYPEWRPGQQELAEGALRALERGQRVMVEAPTGMGKTASVLWAALSFARAHDKQVFWATQRTTQQAVVVDAVRRLRAAGLDLRARVLGARDKGCLNEVVACAPERCRFAEGYYDKLDATDALVALRAAADPSTEAARALGERHAMCPVELALDASEQVDLVVGDVNFALEPGVRLLRHFAEAQAGGWVLVVDEAHALVDRARGWGSPRVSLTACEAAARHLAAWPEEAVAPLRELVAEVAEAVRLAEDLVEGPCRDGVGVADLPVRLWRDLAERVDALALDYARLVAAAWSTGAAPARPDPWLELARAVSRLAAALDAGGEESAHLVGFGAERFVGLANLDPSVALRPRLAALGGFIATSATLTPADYYARTLGLPDDAAVLRADGAFPPEHRAVIVAPRVSTAWRDRARHAPATAALLSRLVAAAPGNAAIYFPSFAMLGDLAPRLALPLGTTLLAQTPALDDATRAAWLDRLGAADGRVVLAAVLGGIFAEGVDLPPGALALVAVVGPGLPPVGLERDLLRDYHDRKDEDGFRYASLIPGLTRVVQAAGRLHRRPEDRGAIVLVDRRFRWREVLELLPDSWSPVVAQDPADAVRAFFAAEAAR